MSGYNWRMERHIHVDIDDQSDAKHVYKSMCVCVCVFGNSALRTILVCLKHEALREILYMSIVYCLRLSSTPPPPFFQKELKNDWRQNIGVSASIAQSFGFRLQKLSHSPPWRDAQTGRSLRTNVFFLFNSDVLLLSSLPWPVCVCKIADIGVRGKE